MRFRPSTFMATLESFQKKYPEPISVFTAESIAFQRNDPFGEKLEAIFTKYQDLIEAGAAKSVVNNNKALIKELEDTVKSRLGMSVKLVTNKYSAAVIPNVYVPHNGILREEMRQIYSDNKTIGGQKQARKRIEGENLGTVNTQTAKVTGWFSEQQFPVFMNIWTLLKTWKMSASEATAIFLHELGHGFNAIIFSSRVNSSNRILSDIVAHISDKGRGGSIEYIYSKGVLINSKMTKDLAEGLLSDNQVVMEVAFYRMLSGISNTLMANQKYDDTGFEAVSDVFASRFGYALPLVTSLERLDKMYPEYKADAEMSSALITLSVILSLVSTAYALTALLTGSIALKVIYTVGTYFNSKLVVGLLSRMTLSAKDMTYDNIRDRYTRIRLQVVELIKDPETPSESKQVLLDQIDTIDTIISDKQVFKSVVEKAATYFIPSERRIAENIELQRSIEGMIANDVFVSANKLALKY